MFENVIVGVDGKPGGRDAIALARRLTATEAKLTLVHVERDVLGPLHRGTSAVEHVEGSRELLERERAAGEVEAGLVSVASASPGRGLHQQAEDLHADLLVVGSCSRGALGRVALGDDTRAALNGAPCAVAIAARGYGEHPFPLAKVGVGYNDTPESEAALATATQLAKPTKASVHALEVVPIVTYGYAGMVAPVVGEGVEEIMASANSRLAQLPDADGRAVYGLTGEELAAFGDEVDLLVIGSRGYGPVRRLMLGSTSEYLERHARCSLLILPRRSD